MPWSKHLERPFYSDSGQYRKQLTLSEKNYCERRDGGKKKRKKLTIRTSMGYPCDW
jgi:hypothetical protein